MLEVRGLHVRYRRTKSKILSDLSIAFSAGTLTIIAGKTGCGKSTLLLALAGIIPQYRNCEFSGEIILDGVEMTTLPLSEISNQIIYVSQDPDIQILGSTVERDIAFGLENLSVPMDEMRSRIEQILEKFGLEHLRSTSPRDLSGGEMRLVSLAAAAVMEPQVLLLDEVMTFLDSSSRKRAISLISDLKDQGTAIIMATHHLEDVLPITDRLALIHGREIFLQGSPVEVLQSEGIQDHLLIPPLVDFFLKVPTRTKIPFTSKSALKELESLLNK